MTNDSTMSRWVCENCGYKNQPIFSNCAKCLRGYDDDLCEPRLTMLNPNANQITAETPSALRISVGEGASNG